MVTYLNKIFSISPQEMENACLDIFRWQYANNPVYKDWCDSIKVNLHAVQSVKQIPFLPVSLYKTHKIVTTEFNEEIIFTSSGTTGLHTSKHYVKDTNLYTSSFTACFELFYGKPQNYCIIALLPSYIERGGSSLVYMVDELIRKSEHTASGFYLSDYAVLANKLKALQEQNQQVFLIGVTYALLDFAEAFPAPLKNTIVMETGGMKGRRTEMTRDEVHEMLRTAFSVDIIHSEYGMTELLSQAYSAGNGLFKMPNWMKALVRQEDDPFILSETGKGVMNIIDLANLYSCCFIATDDLASIYPDGSFEIIGRRDNSDLRGCSLLTIN